MQLLRLALFFVGLTAAACGGSSSESPWPVEPLDAEPGPFGEAPPAGDATDVSPPAEPEPEADDDLEEDLE